MFHYSVTNGKVTNLSLGNLVVPDDDTVYLPTVWTIDTKSIRDAEIERLKTQIKSLQD